MAPGVRVPPVPRADPTFSPYTPEPAPTFSPLPPQGAPESPAPEPSQTDGASRACPEAGVLISTGEVDAAMGLRALTITMTNCGTRPYRVNGYPALRVLDEAGRPLDVEVGEGSSAIALIDGFDASPKPVTLRSGDSVVAGVIWRNTVTDPTVTATTGAYLEIAPAKGRASQTLPEHLDVGNTGKVGVTAWHRPG
jgi:hypothetical protein